MVKRHKYRLGKFLERFMLLMIVLNVVLAMVVETGTRSTSEPEMAQVTSNCDSTCHEERLMEESEEE